MNMPHLLITLSATLLLFSNISFAATEKNERSGKAIYETFCVACHNSGMAGAPKFRNASNWEKRIEQGVYVMTEHTINGFNAMPPKGACMDCSDDEITAAIEHMIEGLQ